MDSIFRSQLMTMCQMYLQPEAAYLALSELGELGIVQFRDVSMRTTDRDTKVNFFRK